MKKKIFRVYILKRMRTSLSFFRVLIVLNCLIISFSFLYNFQRSILKIASRHMRNLQVHLPFETPFRYVHIYSMMINCIVAIVLTRNRSSKIFYSFLYTLFNSSSHTEPPTKLMNNLRY